MKIIEAIWFGGCGIVRVEDDLEEIKYYIRDYETTVDRTIMDDSKYIVEHGYIFPKDAGDVLFDWKDKSNE